MRRDAENAGRRMPGRVGYRCPDGHYTITVTVDAGTVPDRIGCRHPSGCRHHAETFGNPDPWPAEVPAVPDWEWYRPEGDQRERILRRIADEAAPGLGRTLAQHVADGGLLLRPRRRGGR